MGAEEGDSTGAAARAMRWLEGLVAKIRSQPSSSTSRVLSLSRSISFFRVSSMILNLDDPQDFDGNWIPGAMATVIDLVGAAAILSQEGDLKVSAYMDITYLSPAKIDDEVEVDARVLRHKGRVSTVLVELRKKRNGERVALGKLWMASGRPLIKSSKL